MPTAKTVTASTTPAPLFDPPPRFAYEVNLKPLDGAVFLGGPSVTVSGAGKGRQILAGEEFEAHTPADSSWWVRTAAGEVEVSVLADVDEVTA